MKLRDLLFILNELNDIKISRADCHKNDIDNYNPAKYYEVYYGRVINIPSYLYDYYLVKDNLGNPLSTDIDNTNYPYFTLTVSKEIPPEENRV